MLLPPGPEGMGVLGMMGGMGILGRGAEALSQNKFLRGGGAERLKGLKGLRELKWEKE